MDLENTLENLFPGQDKKTEAIRQETAKHNLFVLEVKDFFTTKLLPKLKSMEPAFEKYGLFFHQENNVSPYPPTVAYNYHETKKAITIAFEGFQYKIKLEVRKSYEEIPSLEPLYKKYFQISELNDQKIESLIQDIIKMISKMKPFY